MSNLKKTFYTLFSLAVTAGIFGYLFTVVDLRQVLDIIKNVDRNLLFMFVVLSLLSSLFRTWRYQIVLRESGYQPQSLALFLVVIVRNFFSDLLPARIGTLVYVYIVNSRLGVPLGAAASSFALAFLFDILALVPMVLLAVWFAQSVAGVESIPLLIGGAIALAIVLPLIYSLPFFTRLARTLTLRLPLKQSMKDWCSRELESVERELLVAQRAGIYTRLLVVSILVRLTKYGSFYIMLYALVKPTLGYTLADLPISKAFLGIFASEFAASLPISGIAGFGAYEGTWTTTFHLLGFPLAHAALTGVAHHLFTQVYGYSIGAAAAIALLLPFFRVHGEHEARDTGREHAYRFYGKLAGATTGALLLILSVAYINPVSSSNARERIVTEATSSEYEARALVAKEFPGKILFDSNRDGTFGIYSMRADGSELTKLFDTKMHEMYPDPSPDGSMIVFAQTPTVSRIAVSDVWIMRADGSDARVLVKNGTFPSFSTDGKVVYFERERKFAFQVNVDGTGEKKIFPMKGSRMKGKAIVKPKVSPDGKFIAFTSDKPSRWNAWFGNLETGKTSWIGHGCEPTWFNDSQRLAWVNRQIAQAGSGLFDHERGKKSKPQVLADDGAPWGHEYFPSVSPDNRYLLYSACPAEEHDHFTSNYQLYVKDLQGNVAARITFDGHTHRWPKFFPSS